MEAGGPGVEGNKSVEAVEQVLPADPTGQEIEISSSRLDEQQQGFTAVSGGEKMRETHKYFYYLKHVME